MIISKVVKVNVSVDIDSGCHDKCGTECPLLFFGECWLFGKLRPDNSDLRSFRADKCKEVFKVEEEVYVVGGGYEIDTKVFSA